MAQVKLYIVQKMVMARNAAEAIRLEKKGEVMHVYLDDDWKKNMLVIEQFPKPSETGFVAKSK